ncbi:MAG: hypothetical protein ACRD1R_14070 [Acidobacteriota bacterium]
MKAVERSHKARDLVALLTQKADDLDESRLGQLVASRLTEIISRAQYLDCPDDEAVSKTEQALDDALDLWTQYSSWRAIVKREGASGV